MRNELPGDNPKNIWLSQPTEVPTVTLKLIQQRSRNLRAQTKRKLLGTLAAPAAAAFIYALGMREFHSLRGLLQPLFTIALGWSLAGLYFLSRGMWQAMEPEDSGFRTGLQSCRREIERQRELVRRVLLWSFGPIILAVGTLILALVLVSTKDKGIFPKGLPFLIAVAVWVVAYFVMRWREQLALQREIEELNELEAEYPV